MDYAFAPGEDRENYLPMLRRMLTARTDTTLISKARLVTFAGFLSELVTQGVTANALVPGSHASDEGFLFLALDPTTAVPIVYESLEQVDASGSIQIPASIQGASVDVHVKGCRIGSDDAKPFMKLLKQALGNPQSVTAPKYFHGLLSFRGIYEFMAYSYSVANRTPFADRASLIAAFVAEGFTEELDGTPVPDTKWADWVKRGLALRPATGHTLSFNFPVTIEPPTPNGVAAIPSLKAQCRSRPERYTYTLGVPGAIPSSGADRLDLVKTALSSEPFMQGPNDPVPHPYPQYQRLHFADFDDFWNGLTWRVTVNRSDLVLVGTHYVYTLVIPILKPGTTTRELLFNFYPANGASVMNFEEDNATYDMFGVV
jgi:hypothetical protein